MENIILIIACVIGLILMIKGFIKSKSNPKDNSRPPIERKPKPGQEISNDKLVVVKGVSYEDLKIAITDFCNLYNQEEYAVLPRLVTISNLEFVTTFPFDIKFEHYCFFINYIKYPMELKYNCDITGWATTKSNDKWITEKSANKKVMLFIPEDDDKYDNVFMTTDDNIGYMLGFGMKEGKQLPDDPNKKFVPQAFDIKDILGKPSEDFQ